MISQSYENHIKQQRSPQALADYKTGRDLPQFLSEKEPTFVNITAVDFYFQIVASHRNLN
jgi:hypothetical protein